MNRSVAAVLIAFLAWGAAPAFAQTSSKSDGSTGIVGPTMTPTPTIKQKPQTPTQGAADGSVRNVRLPAVVTYEAMLQKVRGTLPARLGGWSCANAVCTLKVSGDASRVKAIDACKSFQQLAKEKGLRYELYKFRVNTTTSLTDSDLRICKS